MKFLELSFYGIHFDRLKSPNVVALLLILCSFFPFEVYSQTHYSSNVAIGAKAGMDMSRVFFNPSVEQSFNLGFTGGVMVRYIEENHFGLIGELNFSQRGWKENFEESPYRYSQTLNYMDLGIFAHIFFGRKARFFFNAGPQIGCYLNSNISSNFDPKQISQLPDFPSRYRTIEQMLIPVSQKIDYGISAGLGGEYNINRKNSINLEVRFYYGLGNIFPSKRVDYFNASNQMTLAFTCGYWFRIK